MRILGIDPGYGRVGWAVIESGLTSVDFGTIETDKNLPPVERLAVIHNSLKEIIIKYAPSSASVEKVFFSKNISTAIDVAKAIGVIHLTLRLEGIDFCEYTPSQVKQAVTGYGKADKKQIGFMIQKIFRLQNLPELDDATDALALAACHSFNHTAIRK